MSVPSAGPAAAPAASLVAMSGVFAAVLLPHLLFSTASSDSVNEVKLFGSALAAAAALFGASRSAGGFAGRQQRASPRFLPLSLTLVTLAVVVSALVNFGQLDVLFLVPLLTGLALFCSALHEPRCGTAFRMALQVAGIFTALLAVGQRAGWLAGLPVALPQERFLAGALFGNPGLVGAALFAPALVFWSRALEAGLPARTRLRCGVGFAVCAAGLAATETLAAIAAVAVGVLVQAALHRPRRRWAAVLIAVGVLATLSNPSLRGRLATKARELRAGDFSSFSTQRDIGLLAAAEMVRRNPIVGVGPGEFENHFVPARLSAERRVGRRLTHASSSSHFDNAHNDPATLAAEIGVPALALAVAAFVRLLVAVRHRRERPVEPNELPEDLLIAMLVGLAVLGLASFPLRMPAVVAVLALCLGFAWERVRNGPAPAGGVNGRLRRFLCLALCAALALAASARVLSVRFQADGERLLREANVSEGVDRLDRLENAEGLLGRSVALRPGHPQAWLALGNTRRLTGDLDGARTALARSLALEERAETDLNLGLLMLARGEARVARQWFVRALWLAPNLKAALPAEADPDAVAAEVAEAERRMAAGAEPPVVPSKG